MGDFLKLGQRFWRQFGQVCEENFANPRLPDFYQWPSSTKGREIRVPYLRQWLRDAMSLRHHLSSSSVQYRTFKVF